MILRLVNFDFGAEMVNKFIVFGLIFVFVIVSGVWLSRTGRPLNAGILAVHKLIALGAAVYLAVTIYRIHQGSALQPVELAVSLLTLLFFIVLIATGGILSAAKAAPEAVHRVHQFMPYLVMLSSAASLYLLLVRRV
jgi:hypothetical protein